jgi:cellulose synthase/poly-beta-1,6-N-acetylglucosamine synthase-like glycosyltransferase
MCLRRRGALSYEEQVLINFTSLPEAFGITKDISLMNARIEEKITAFCLAVTVLLLAAFLVEFLEHGLNQPTRSIFSVGESLLFLVVAVSLMWGNFLYQLTRYGYFGRKTAFRSALPEELKRFYKERKPSSITVLIPSYKEELDVLQQTIVSAALLDYPKRRIVVLIDNPPNVSGRDLRELYATRALIDDLNAMFAAIGRSFERESERFFGQRENVSCGFEAKRLSRLYEQAATCLDVWVENYSKTRVARFAHHDKLFLEKVLKALAKNHRTRAASLVSATPDVAAIACEYRRITALFKVEISSFERKSYANLSHEPNKAMNLNSYIGLIGKSYREEWRNGALWLVECTQAESDFCVPESDYVLTLDADSVLLPDYAIRLAHTMDNDPAIAVAQTPYSAFPGAPGTLERIAGATTDLQYIVHQGFTSSKATYWVGANALLRLKALRDIEQRASERGHAVPVYIQDRTVIEDTESTVDLISRGWTLFNYPERLAYSATPPDFGSLVIQRRRWANGGLIIVPKLLRYMRNSSGSARARLSEAFMRLHYLCSPAAGSFGALAILFVPFDDSFTSIWLIATAFPYFFLYSRDLRQSGYRTFDVLRVYALILLLLSVNLSGVFRSLKQIISRRKSAFCRTPKIEGRTASPPTHLLFQWALIALLALECFIAISEGRYGHAAFAIGNMAALLYAMTSFIGWRNQWIDVSTALGVRPIRLLFHKKIFTLGDVRTDPVKNRVHKARHATSGSPVMAED